MDLHLLLVLISSLALTNTIVLIYLIVRVKDLFESYDMLKYHVNYKVNELEKSSIDRTLRGAPLAKAILIDMINDIEEYEQSEQQLYTKEMREERKNKVIDFLKLG